MPHLDYLTYLSQIFWFLVFFWLAYFLFFFIFLPKLYYSFRIRKLKFDFLFDKYVSNEYKINFYNFFFKEYSDKFTNIVFIFLKAVKTKSNLLVLTAFKKMKIFKFYLNLYLSDVLYFYWNKGIILNFNSLLIQTFFMDWKKFSLLNKLNADLLKIN